MKMCRRLVLTPHHGLTMAGLWRRRAMLPRVKEQPTDPPGDSDAAAPGAGAPATPPEAATPMPPPGGPVDGQPPHLPARSPAEPLARAAARGPAEGPAAHARGHGGAAGPARDSDPATHKPREGTAGGSGVPGTAAGGGPPAVPAAARAPAGEESFRRIPLDATRPGAGLSPEERVLFLGGALTRAKRDTGGVGAQTVLRTAMPWH